MGIYKYYQKYNNYPSYYGPGGRRLYFLIGSGWLIGPTLGNPTGYIHNRGASINDTGTEGSHPYLQASFLGQCYDQLTVKNG